MKSLLLVPLFVFTYLTISAQVYQFRGPDRDGKFPEKGLLQEWPVEGPNLILEFEGIGDGWSSVIYDGDQIYASGKVDSMDQLTCIDLEGNLKWQVAYGRAWEDSYPNTRSTPTVEGDRVYIISGMGEVVCLDKNNGAINWKIDADKKYQADWHLWGVAESPLIVDDKVICSPAGFLTNFVAFDKITGKEIWRTTGNDSQRSYVSPVLHEFNGRDYIIGASASDLFIVDPENGEIMVSYKYFDPEVWKWQPKGLIWANSPIAVNDRIFISKGYDYAAKMLKVSEDLRSIEEVYTNTMLDNHHHGIIELDGYLYGSNWINNSNGNWVCIKWEDGQTMYEEKWVSKGQMIYADGKLYLFNERSGEVALVEPDPGAFKLISSFKVDHGRRPFWSHPYIFDGKLFLRADDTLMVYDIRE
jgi:outer membrane protein assembly factor BamB